MQSGLAVLSFCLVVSLSNSAIQNVFNFQIPRRVPIEDKKYQFSNAIKNFVNRFHWLQNRKQTANVFDKLMNGGKLKHKINEFRFKSCGGFAGNITKLELLPDPLNPKKPISIAASGYINSTIYRYLEPKAVFSIWKDDKPYYHYTVTDVCTFLNPITCPEALTYRGIPCECPFYKGIYNLPPTVFPFDYNIDPGKYHINLEVDVSEKKAACLDIFVEVG